MQKEKKQHADNETIYNEESVEANDKYLIKLLTLLNDNDISLSDIDDSNDDNKDLDESFMEANDKKLNLIKNSAIDQNDPIIKNRDKKTQINLVKKWVAKQLSNKKQSIKPNVLEKEEVSNSEIISLLKSILSKRNKKVDGNLPEQSNITNNNKKEGKTIFESIFDNIYDKTDVKKSIKGNNINVEEGKPIKKRRFTKFKAISSLIIISLFICIFVKYYPNNFIKRSLCKYTSICQPEKRVPARINTCLSENIELEHNN